MSNNTNGSHDVAVYLGSVKISLITKMLRSFISIRFDLFSLSWFIPIISSLIFVNLFFSRMLNWCCVFLIERQTRKPNWYQVHVSILNSTIRTPLSPRTLLAYIDDRSIETIRNTGGKIITNKEVKHWKSEK